MIITREFIEEQHSGYVIERPTQKSKIVVVEPMPTRRHNMCESCRETFRTEKLLKTVNGNSHHRRVECIDCYLRRKK